MVTTSIHVFPSFFSPPSPFRLSFLPAFSCSSSSPRLVDASRTSGRLTPPVPCSATFLIMNVFVETSYSNLFAAGLRVIHSRSTGRRSSSDPQLSSLVSLSSSIGAVDHDQHPPVSSRTPSSRKTFHFPTRLWRLPSPRSEKSGSADANIMATKDANSKPARRRSMPGGTVEETTLDVRIWDWSTRMSFANTILE